MATTKKKKPASGTQVCRLHQLVLEYKAAHKSYQVAKSVAPLKPILQPAYTVDQFSKHKAAMEKYKADLKRFEEQEAAAAQKLKLAHQALKGFLPAVLTWFVTEDEKYAVALQTSDWPMDPPQLLIRQNPVVAELPKLRMQVIN